MLRRPIELLFFAYRDFTGVADRVLAAIGFGRAHHRAIYFVGRAPGMTVGELLGILRITKQSLAPVLRDLIVQGYVVQRADAHDRRRRRLHLTEKGVSLERDLTRRQSRMIARAVAAAGAEAEAGFDAVLLNLVDPLDRGRFSEKNRRG
ncbi:MAG: MarR family transcriptional regulator [Alphaproteobacteria bacterium]|nr:MarR family transcriptional regulator [Alphaproteobacteria bacterium]